MGFVGIWYDTARNSITGETMLKKPSLTGRIIAFLMLASLLASCAAPTAMPSAVPPTAAPTMDPATVVAAAVSTISAQMTEQALLNPTATPLPTNTPVPPTATPLPPTPTLEPAAATQQAQPTALPADAPVGGLSAKFLYSATYPGNKREYLPNETFSLAMGFQNNGTASWEPGSMLQITGFVGEVTVQQDAKLEKGVAPGEKAEFNLWAFGSETITTHTWYFQIVQPSGGVIPGGYGSFTYTSITD